MRIYIYTYSCESSKVIVFEHVSLSDGTFTALNVASLVGIWYYLLIASMRYSRQCSRGLDGSCAASKPQT